VDYGFKPRNCGSAVMGRILLIFILVGFSASSFASSCCGQSPSSFTVLSLEQSFVLTSAYTYADSVGRVYDNGDFRVWNGDKHRDVKSLSLNLSGSFLSRHQWFAAMSFLEGEYSDSSISQSSKNLSDTLLGYTFEALPEYRFSYWKPVVYLSALINVPTGKSTYETLDLGEGAGVTGHNQWGLGVGMTLKKVYFPLSLTLQMKSLRIFPETFGSVRVSGFYDNSIALLGNYSLGIQDLSINGGVTTSQTTEKEISTTAGSSGKIEKTAVLFGIQKVFTDDWSGGLNYSDETLLGDSKNTLLNRSYTLSFSRTYF